MVSRKGASGKQCIYLIILVIAMCFLCYTIIPFACKDILDKVGNFNRVFDRNAFDYTVDVLLNLIILGNK